MKVRQLSRATTSGSATASIAGAAAAACSNPKLKTPAVAILTTNDEFNVHLDFMSLSLTKDRGRIFTRCERNGQQGNPTANKLQSHQQVFEDSESFLKDRAWQRINYVPQGRRPRSMALHAERSQQLPIGFQTRDITTGTLAPVIEAAKLDGSREEGLLLEARGLIVIAFGLEQPPDIMQQ
jgi:hypothetical protein